jgi:hypothetical protein
VATGHQAKMLRPKGLNERLDFLYAKILVVGGIGKMERGKYESTEICCKIKTIRKRATSATLQMFVPQPPDMFGQIRSINLQ